MLLCNNYTFMCCVKQWKHFIIHKYKCIFGTFFPSRPTYLSLRPVDCGHIESASFVDATRPAVVYFVDNVSQGSSSDATAPRPYAFSQ